MQNAGVIAEQLWKEHRPSAEAQLAHPFVRGIATGDLPRERFAAYVAQDAWFLDAFARAYALALAKSPDGETLREFADLLVGVLDELELHAGYAARWGVDLRPDPAPATLAYTDFLLRVASLEPAGHAAAAMTPCMRLYAFLGQSLAAGGVDPSSPYREWVETYASDEFEALAARLEELLDRLGGDESMLRSHYGTAMALEHRFWDSAWEG
jgi:thiaminase/transcriptional activator TenA